MPAATPLTRAIDGYAATLAELRAQGIVNEGGLPPLAAQEAVVP